jgi:hypothetical protein
LPELLQIQELLQRQQVLLEHLQLQEDLLQVQPLQELRLLQAEVQLQHQEQPHHGRATQVIVETILRLIVDQMVIHRDTVEVTLHLITEDQVPVQVEETAAPMAADHLQVLVMEVLQDHLHLALVATEEVLHPVHQDQVLLVMEEIQDLHQVEVPIPDLQDQVVPALILLRQDQAVLAQDHTHLHRDRVVQVPDLTLHRQGRVAQAPDQVARSLHPHEVAAPEALDNRTSTYIPTNYEKTFSYTDPGNRLHQPFLCPKRN